MDAFCGFVRGIRGKSEELGVFYVEMRAFSSQFSTTCWEKIFFGPPLWLEPPRSISDSSKTAGLHSRQARFLNRGKSHRVRLRGVDPKIHRKRPKKERLKNWFVLTKKSEAWLLVACCCCQGHATAPTHHIGRLCKRRALFVLARGELSGFLNTKLSVGVVWCVSPRMYSEELRAFF